MMVVLSAYACASTTYYVSSSAGSDSYTATQAQNPATPWQTLAKVGLSTFAAGDRILLARGDVWREALVPPSPGIGGAPIVFDGKSLLPREVDESDSTFKRSIGFDTTGLPPVEAKLVDAGALTVEETWSFERYNTDGTTTPGSTKKVLRSYALEDGGLVKSPKADPVR